MSADRPNRKAELILDAVLVIRRTVGKNQDVDAIKEALREQLDFQLYVNDGGRAGESLYRVELFSAEDSSALTKNRVRKNYPAPEVPGG